MISARSRSQAGISLLELLFAFSILTLIGLNVAMVMRTSSMALTTGIMGRVVDEQAELTMQRISFAVMGASAEELDPTLVSPLSTQKIDYQTCLGFEQGLLVMGDLERIEYVGDSQSIIHTKNPGLAGALSSVWSQWVPVSLDGEAPNSLDDNGNGLVDEPGLCFDSVGPKVNIRLTLSRKDSTGQNHKRTLSNTVTCRN